MTKSRQTKEEEHRAPMRLVTKARPRPKPAVKLPSVSIPVRDRKWTDIEAQRSHDHRAIQGHSGDNATDPELQDNVLLPEGFTEHIYHVGNASEILSIITSGKPSKIRYIGAI